MIGRIPNPTNGFRRETDSSMKTPDILFLNGTSSSGKTTISQLLQHQLEEVFLHVSLDAFAAMFPQSKLGDKKLCSLAEPKLFAGFYRCVAALASCENKVIVDTVVFDSQQEMFEALFQPFDVVYVAVRCSLEQLEQREKVRGDRAIGLARKQFSEVHRFLKYDIEVDTSGQSAQQCAETIQKFLQRNTT